MFFLTSLSIAFIIVLITNKKALAHRFTDQVKLDIINTMKYGVNWNSSLPFRNTISYCPREYIVNKNIKSMSSYYYKGLEYSFKKLYEEYDDSGNIKRAFEFDREGSIVKTAIYNYNAELKITEIIEYSPAGNIHCRQTYKYEDGEISEFAYFGRDDKPLYKIEYSRKEGRTSKIKRSEEDGSISESIYKYSNGRLNEKKYYSDRDGDVTERYNYDHQNRLLEVVTTNPQNSEISRLDYNYNENGLPIAIVFNNSQTGFKIENNLLFDKEGELVSLSTKTSSPQFIMSLSHRFENDSDGNWTFYFFSGDNADHPDEIYRYGRDGALLESVAYLKSGDMEHAVKYTYSQDFTENLPAEPAAFATDNNIRKECGLNMRMLEGAIDLYQMENGDELPESLEKLAELDYIQKVPQCPGNGKYSFEKSDLSKDAGTDFFRIEIECSVHGGLY
ncbi:MAG TPA: hypothetical protein PKW98_01515 [Candidatus Wallbacteria bacterium]|nr:hypothetical protein [Candidatus Wallbacteria bacterium]